jgi:N-acetylglucosaminyldiphosphoundecaprenol N-acetyl-beta-D-mannosaminyltransferase
VTAREELPRVRHEFLGIHFDVLSEKTLMQVVVDREAEACFEYVVTPNVDHVIRLHQPESRLDSPYRDAAYTVCDSRILPLLARFAGIRLQSVPGSDLTAQLFKSVIGPNDTVTILGSGSGEVARLKSRYGLSRISHHSPPMNLLRDQAAISEAVHFAISHPARYVFFALGSPQQEIIAHRIWETGKAVGTGFCIGASIDFLTGKASRAPEPLRRMRLEWLYRLVSEPGRLWRRYLVDDMRIFAIFFHWLRDRRS